MLNNNDAVVVFLQDGPADGPPLQGGRSPEGP